MCRGRIQWWQSRTVSGAPVAGKLPQLAKEVQPLLGLSHNGVYVIVPLQVLGDGGAQESEWLHCSHSAVHDGEWGESRGVSPEVHDHLHCFEHVKLEVVKTAPDSQLLNLLSVGRLVTVLNEAGKSGVVCKLQELDRGVFRCAVVRVEGEKQWGENAALRGSSAGAAGAGWEFSQPHKLLPVCQEAGDPLTDGGGYRELCPFILKGVRDDGVKSGAEVYKQDPHISPWSVQMLQDEVQSNDDCIIHRPVCSVGLQISQNQSFKWFHDHRR